MSETVNLPSFYGYPNTVFQACSVAIAYLSAVLNADTANTATVYADADNVFTTLRNGIDCVAAWQLQQAWASELVLLDEISILPLTLTAAQQAYLENRISCLNNATVAIQNILPNINPSGALTLLQNNALAIPDPGLLNFYQNFNYETAPVGYTAPQTVAYSVFAQQAWEGIAIAVLTYQGPANLTQAFDEAVRTIAAFTELSNIYSGNTNLYGPFAAANVSDQVSWSQTLSLPSLQLSANSISGAPYSYTNQQCGVIRYVLGSASQTIAQLLVSLRQPSYGQANLGTLLQNDTLMDLANRGIGNFEQWQEIATLNGLAAPWTGPNGAAQPGQQLLLPTVTGQTPDEGLPVPSYDNNVMGTDWYLGPIGQEMLPWAGDVQLISGLNNLSVSLSRRLLTPLGQFIYHNDFGSRIPPEVGNVQTSAEANLLVAFGKSSLLQDPRVQQVVNATVVLNQNGYGIASLSATVQPIGASSTSQNTTVNAVVAASP